MKNLYWMIVRALGRGRVTLVNDDGVIQTAQVQISQNELRDDTPRMAEYGLTSNPPIGTDAVVNFLGGDRNFGVIVATNHQASRPKGLSEGESMLYQQNGLQIYLSNNELIVNATNLPVTINDATTCTINCKKYVVNCEDYEVNASKGTKFDTPLLAAAGDIQDNSPTNSMTMETMRSDYNRHQHEVDGIKTGSSSVISNIPTVIE
jgi:phage baseplate assembly protein V